MVDNNTHDPPDRDGKMYEMSVPFDNLAPFVDAGPNKTIAIADPLTITGDSYDDGQPTLDPLDLTWSKVSGPGTVTFGSPKSLSTTVSFSEVGGSADPYVLELKSDDGSLFSVDTMQVAVFADPPVNQPPTVFAGSNQTVVLPNLAILAGAASDDGLPDPPNVVTTTWSKVSGPGSVTFGNVSTLDTTASFSTDGVYVLRLTADDSALQSTDDVIVTVNASAPVNTFIDDDGHFAENAIEWLAAEGITEGCNPPTNNKYCPNDFVSRGEMAVFLARAYNLPATSTDYFTDDNGRFYENAANKLFEAGLTVGCGPSKYCGESQIDRDEMAAMLARAEGLPSTSTDYFVDDNGSIFENAINKIAEARITVGCNPPDNDRYCPDQSVTRGEMAVLIKRALS